MIAIGKTSWDSHIQESERFCMYSQYKTTITVEPYLLLNMNRYVKIMRALVHFRLKISNLFVHKYRYRNANQMSNMCRLCLSETEDEVHFVLGCSKLDSLRKELIPPKFSFYPSRFNLISLLSVKDEKTLNNFATFLYKSFKLLEQASV